jgi:hypothetical protein
LPPRRRRKRGSNNATPPNAGPVPSLIEDDGFTIAEIFKQELERTRVGRVRG